jgi:hypothetical protein
MNKKSIREFYLVMSHSENFVGHTSVQEVFDLIWSGETNQKVILIGYEIISILFFLDQR